MAEGTFSYVPQPFILSKREYFSVMAMQGLLANADITKSIAKMIESGKYNISTHGKVVIAEMAVQSADALIKALDE